MRSSIWRDRMAENSSAKPSSRDCSLRDLGLQLVVGDAPPEWPRTGRWRWRTAPRRCRARRPRATVFFEAAIDVNEVMMPHTVPNRPIKGPAEPMVARTSRLRFEPLDLALDGDVEHLVDALAAGSGTSRPEPSNERFHSRMAATNTAARPVAGRSSAASGRAPRATGRTRTPPRSGPSRACVRAKQQRLVDDDRPAPDRGAEQARASRA